MAIIGALDKTKHFSEFNDPLFSNEGVIAPSARKAAALANLGAASAAALAGVTVLTDNTAGTANDTLEALADGTTYANDVAAIRNNFADLAAKINEILAALD